MMRSVFDSGTVGGHSMVPLVREWKGAACDYLNKIILALLGEYIHVEPRAILCRLRLLE